MFRYKKNETYPETKTLVIIAEGPIVDGFEGSRLVFVAAGSDPFNGVANASQSTFIPEFSFFDPSAWKKEESSQKKY